MIDCTFHLHGTLGEPLRDLDYFRQVRVDAELRTIVWTKGLDPVPELLHGHLVPDDPHSPRRVAVQSHRVPPVRLVAYRAPAP